MSGPAKVYNGRSGGRGWILTLLSPLDTPKAKRIADQWAKVKYAPCISAPMEMRGARELFAMRKEALEVQALLTAAGIASTVEMGPPPPKRPKSKERRMREALDNLVGPGAQHEHTCDKAEHDEDSACIYCEARAALAFAQAK